MPEVAANIQEKAGEAFRVAKELNMHNPGWEVFFREIVGNNGVVKQLFTTPEELSAFAQTDEYAEIHKMLATLRNPQGESTERREPTRVITVRLPKSLHESLRAEAHEHQTSMNKLCISKLLQAITEDLVPSDVALVSQETAEG